MLAEGALPALGCCPTWLDLQLGFRQAQHPALLLELVTPAKLRLAVEGSSKVCSRGHHAWQEGLQSGYVVLPATCRDLSLVPGRDVYPGTPRPLPLMMCISMIQRTQLFPLQMR